MFAGQIEEDASKKEPLYLYPYQVYGKKLDDLKIASGDQYYLRDGKIYSPWPLFPDFCWFQHKLKKPQKGSLLVVTQSS